MELIPVLSTIILVATISTFLLAIGAYILYKIRERKGQAAVITQPSEVKAELVTPAAERQAARSSRYVTIPTISEPKKTPSYQRPAFVQHESVKPQKPMQPRFTPKPQPYTAYRPPYSATSEQSARQFGTVGYSSTGYQYSGYPQRSEEEKRIRDSKFLKYTSEGYIPAKEDKDSGALKWR